MAPRLRRLIERYPNLTQDRQAEVIVLVWDHYFLLNGGDLQEVLDNLIDHQQKYEATQNYEMCAVLRDVLKYFDELSNPEL